MERIDRLWNDGWIFHLENETDRSQGENPAAAGETADRHPGGREENARFTGQEPALFAGMDADESSFLPVQLPHDWSIGLPLQEDAPSGSGGGYVTGGIGWYRKHFTYHVSGPERSAAHDSAVPERNAESGAVSHEAAHPARQIRHAVVFEGVYMDAAVYLNGKKIAGNPYGYTSFVAELDPALQEGDNVLAVRVNNSRQPNSRWYSGSGIYRDVHYVETAAVHIDDWGIRCAAAGIYPEENQAQLEIRGLLRNDTGRAVAAGIHYTIRNAAGDVVATAGTAALLPAADPCRDTVGITAYKSCGGREASGSESGAEAAGEAHDTRVMVRIENPHLWTCEDPYLYTVECTLTSLGKIVDKLTLRTGIRTAVFDADRGFLLNGVPVKIKGMCVHHDCGVTGAVGYRESWQRRLEKLKDMGCNGIRSAHNPPVPALLDLCDEMGFLVLDEIYDEWTLTKNKTQNYYSQNIAYGSSMFFQESAETDLVRMLRRDYNHPSVILWSIGNEIPEQSAPDGVGIARRLQNICHREDASRMVTSACDNIAAPASFRTRREFADVLDVTGYNYVGRWGRTAETFYDDDRAGCPGRRFIGTENPSAGGARGMYGEAYRTLTMQHEALWRYENSHDFVSGDYLWTGIDYYGEAPWPLRGAASGPIDTAGFEKDTYYYFRSIWNTKDATLHLVPDNWNGKLWKKGEFVTVLVYTNCELVKLFLNGKHVGDGALRAQRFGCSKAWNDRPWAEPTTNDLHVSFTVPYEPGELKAEGYVDGKLVKTEILRTTGPAERLAADVYQAGTDPAEPVGEPVSHASHQEDRMASPAPGRMTGRASGSPDDHAVSVGHPVQIVLTAVDAAGRIDPDCRTDIHCRVEGPGHLIGMDAGDMRDLSLLSESHRRMLAGKLLAVVMADAPGEIRVRLEGEGLAPAEVVVHSL